MMGALYACIGLVILPFLVLAGFASMLVGQRGAAMSGVGMLILAILAPILYGVMGFLIGALTAWIYNLVARRVGGIRLELKPDSVSVLPAPS
jgi:hypothetical protein